jgi:hypothetical protein
MFVRIADTGKSLRTTTIPYVKNVIALWSQLRSSLNSMEQMTIYIKGRIPSKKNSKQMILVRGKRIIVPSRQYSAWYKEQRQELAGIPKLRLNEVSIEMTITFPDNIKSDLTNKAESIMDLLVDSGIIEDDNHKVCKKITLISGGVNKQAAGAKIKIKFLKNPQKGG